MLRIFLSSSHLSTLFMALHAKKTHSPDCKDILIVESAKIKESLLKLIHGTNIIHTWNEIHDFVSIVKDTQDLKPSFRKTITRKLKTKPIAKQVYDALYAIHVKNERKKLKERLQSLFRNYNSSHVELHLLSQTLMNPVLFELFPKAKVRYFEHGLGDYLYMQELTHKGNFHCVFAEPYKKFLTEKKMNTHFIFPSAPPADFENASMEITKNLRLSDSTVSPCVFILMEDVKMYYVKKNFWKDYMERCLSGISSPQQYTYLLKPHPAQPIGSIEITKSFFEKQGLKYKLLDEPALTGMSAEVLFAQWKNNIHHVFALFSSSVFYLSVLYPLPHITYHYSYDYMAKHLGNATEQAKKHFKGLEELIEKVFSGNCKKFPL